MNPLEVEVAVQIGDPFADRVSPDLLIRAATTTLCHQGVTGSAALTVVVTGDGTVCRLNQTYRGMDAPTDVLAFGAGDERGFVTSPEASSYLGDVVISFPRAEAQARNAGHPVEAELQLLTVHGVLHLLGRDHAEPEEKAVMWSVQAEILRELGVSVVNPTPGLEDRGLAHDPSL